MQPTIPPLTTDELAAEMLLHAPIPMSSTWVICHCGENQYPCVRARLAAGWLAESARAGTLADALDADAADLWRITNAIRAELDARGWLVESSGRGPYAWDDDRHQEEFGHTWRSVMRLIATVQHPAQRRFREAMEIL